jgi:hypothetical protein
MPILLILTAAAAFMLRFVVTKTLLILGLTYVTYLGIDLVFTTAEEAVFDNLGGLPAAALNYALMTGIDVYLTLTFSAMTAAMTIKGISAGVKTALRFASA